MDWMVKGGVCLHDTLHYSWPAIQLSVTSDPWPFVLITRFHSVRFSTGDLYVQWGQWTLSVLSRVLKQLPLPVHTDISFLFYYYFFHVTSLWFPIYFLVDHTAFYVTLIQKCSVDIKDFFHYSLYVSKLDIFKKKSLDQFLLYSWMQFKLFYLLHRLSMNIEIH